MKRKILIITISYIIGFIWGLYFNINIALFLSTLGIITSIVKKKKILLLTLSIITIATIWANREKNRYNNTFNGIKECYIEGIVIENPIYDGSIRKYNLKIIRANNKKVIGNLKVIVYEKMDKSHQAEVTYGDYLSSFGEFVSPSESRNYKGFNYKEYLKTQKIVGSIRTTSEKIYKKRKSKIYIYNRCIHEVNNYIQAKIQKILPRDTSNLFIAIVLGDKTELDERIITNFSEGNLSHILAVSGMHLSYIVAIISFLLSFCGRKHKKIYTIVFVILFCNIAGNTYSIVRASIMIILYLFGCIVHRKSDSLTNISIAALIILIYNPYAIKSFSFLLSFTATLGIILFKTNIDSKLPQFMDKNFVTRYIKNSISLGISANILLIPITAIYFNKISFVFIISNILATVIISIIMPLGIGCIIISIFSVSIAKVFSYFLNTALGILIFISKLSSKIQILNFTVITPNYFKIVIYLLIVGMCSTQIEKYKKYLKKALKIIVISYIAISIISRCNNALNRDMKIYFIDVGQGDSTLIVTPKEKTILLDGGGSEESDYIGKNVLIPYLLNRGIRKIDYVIISHFDTDHVRWNT